MAEQASRATTQNARKERNDRLVRRLTTASTTVAVGLTGVFAGLSVNSASPHHSAIASGQLGPAADAALAKAIADYRAAATPPKSAAPRHPVVATAPSRPFVAVAPRPVAIRHPAVAVSGGS
jgi:hypothetical protein